EIVDILALKYDYQNLKLKIKYELKDKELNFEYLGENGLEKDYILAKEEYEKTGDIQKSMILLDKLYLTRIRNIALNIDEDITNEYYENVLNKYNIITFLRLKNQNRNIDYATYSLAFDDDLINIYEEVEYINLLKEKYKDEKMWKAYDNTNKISDIEKILENKFIEFSKKYKYVSHGIEPVITYILAKEFEMKAIKLIYTAKLNKLPSELIKERVRDIYV
ncbi:V-type ATPase subunit, partial [Oceanivirga salmonicida]